MVKWENYNLPELRMGKARLQPSPYNTSTPFAGPLFIEKITDDIPVEWQCTITCENAVQAQQFRAFLSLVNLTDPFCKDVLTEFGFVEHEVRITSGIPAPSQINVGVWEYSFTLYADELLEPDFVECFPDLTARYLHQAKVIDIACNQLWPA